MKRKGTKIIEVSNGWAKSPLRKFGEAVTQILDIHAGTPLRPSMIDESDIRTERKGFFAGLKKAFGGKIRSQITVTSRPFSSLWALKQVFLLFSVY